MSEINLIFLDITRDLWGRSTVTAVCATAILPLSEHTHMSGTATECVNK